MAEPSWSPSTDYRNVARAVLYRYEGESGNWIQLHNVAQEEIEHAYRLKGGFLHAPELEEASGCDRGYKTDDSAEYYAIFWRPLKGRSHKPGLT